MRFVLVRKDGRRGSWQGEWNWLERGGFEDLFWGGRGEGRGREGGEVG